MIIVDGYNVIHKWKGLMRYRGNLELARSRLIDQMANYQGYIDEEIMVVFDSSLKDKPSPAGIPPNIRVVFAPRGQTTDTFVERLVYSHAAPSRITVVTGDRLFRMTVLEKDVRTVSPEGFEKEVRRVCSGR